VWKPWVALCVRKIRFNPALGTAAHDRGICNYKLQCGAILQVEHLVLTILFIGTTNG